MLRLFVMARDNRWMLIVEVLPGTDPAGDIFPVEIRDASWVGYHGTSSAYSASIEAQGLRLEKPLPPNDIAFVAELARRFPQAGADADAVHGFLALGTISFTSDPSVTLKYLLPNWLGGQGVGFVAAAAEALLEAQNIQLPPTERERLDTVAAAIRYVRCQQPVIYAVDLKGLERMNYDSITAGIYAHQWIPPDRILAKALISEGVAIDTEAGSVAKVRQFRELAGSWLSQIPRDRPGPRAWDLVAGWRPTGEYCPWHITAEEPNADRFVEITSAAFGPRAWALLHVAEKRTAEKSFVRELGRAYVNVAGQKGIVDAKRMAVLCLRAFLSRETRPAFHAAADDPELLLAMQDLAAHEVVCALPRQEAQQFVEVAREALPGAAALFAQ